MKATMENVRLDEMRGAPVYDRDGDKIGTVDELYYDSTSRTPEWIGVGTGFFGMKRVLVPVQGASLYEDGISVPYDKDHVKDSPEIDDEQLYGEREHELYRYYGRDTRASAGFDRSADTATGRSLTRSEEELQVGKRETEAGRVRLRKWVETEPVALDVELRRETARVVREDLNTPVGRDSDAFREQEVEVPLRSEQPVVAKQTVAKERVGVETDVETRSETVRDDVRKERIEVEGDADH